MTKSTQRGFIVLTTLLLAIVCLMILVEGSKHEEPAPIADSLEAQADSLVARYERRQKERQQRYEQSRSRPSVQNRHTRSTTYLPNDSQTDTFIRHNTYRPKPALVFDLNEADTTDLQQLRGIGPVYARRIVNYRNRLGGFVSKEQLMEVYGMSDSLFRSIAPHLTLDHPEVQKLNINTATLDELKRHAYLDYYKARAIVRFREQVGPFTQKEDLLMVNLIDPETYTKLSPYITL